MFFDDRLATVLRQRADSDTMRRTQFRQLLDILGSERMGEPRATRDPSLLASAWLRMDALADAIPASERARMIREPGWRFRSPELASHLADFEPDVASAALNRAQLSAEDWTALIPRLPVRARGFLRLRRDLPVDAETLLDRLGVSDRGLPSPPHPPPASGRPASAFVAVSDDEDTLELSEIAPDEPAPLAEPEPEPEPEPDVPAPVQEGRSEISAIVERIAQFKRDRERPDAPPPAKPSDNDNPLMPRLPLGEEAFAPMRQARAFGFAADTAGRIEWTDAEVARMVIGTRLFPSRRLGTSHELSPLERAFARRQPMMGLQTSLDGAKAIVGEWIVDAQPRFTEGGHFAGYVGRFRRPPEAVPAGPSAAERDADSVRQLLHELRTPVTAIQGYAEIIQQQLFGSAPHEYRGLAAAIAADAAKILAGFEELDRLAKLDTGALELSAGEADLTGMARTICGQLAQVLAPRLAGIEPGEETGDGLVVSLDPDDLEALLWRMLATLGGGCGAGEMLTLKMAALGPVARLTCDLPAQLLGEEDIFAAEARPLGSSINAGLFGAGFALRLARAEARAAGGSLMREEDRLVLTLPLWDASAITLDDAIECEADL